MAITIGTVTISRNPSYSSEWWSERINQETIITADAGRATYDNGTEIIRGTLVLQNVSKAEGDALMAYITDTAIFGENSFTITPPTNTDVGAGVGTALTDAYFDGGTSLQGVFEFIAPALYNIKFSYWKKV
jgi:hypothetical protein